MIDTKELRRLLEEDGKNNIDLDEIHELLDRLEAAEKDVALKERVIDALGSELNTVANKRDALRAKIEEMEIGKREISEAHNVAKRRLSALADESIALQAKIAEMEQQEPIGEIVAFGEFLHEPSWKRGKLPHLGTKLYAIPGAQPAPSIPEGWKLVPIEPTEKMINEGTCASALPGPRYIDSACAKQCWTNMLAAAPEAKP